MFSTAVMDRFLNPKNSGELQRATHYGQVGIPGDGYYAQLWLRISGEQIEQASFQTYPCPVAVACLSLTTELVSGRSVHTAGILDSSDLIAILGGLPEGKEHCAERATEALQIALTHCVEGGT